MQIETSQSAWSLPNSVKFGYNGVDFIVRPFKIHGHMFPSVNSQNNDAAQCSDDSFQDATWLVAVHFHREENCLGRHLCCHLEPLGGQAFWVPPSAAGWVCRDSSCTQKSRSAPIAQPWWIMQYRKCSGSTFLHSRCTHDVTTPCRTGGLPQRPWGVLTMLACSISFHIREKDIIFPLGFWCPLIGPHTKKEDAPHPAVSCTQGSVYWSVLSLATSKQPS